MTRKRYRGLCRELMNRILKRGEVLGSSYRLIRDLNLKSGKHEFKSYSEAWESLAEIRKNYGM